MLPIGAVAPGNQRIGGQDTAGAASPRVPTNRRTRERPQPSQLHVTVPVAFNRHLGCGDAAFVLAEMLRHTLFMRGQLPMPYQQLLKVLDEREERDAIAREERAAEAEEAAATAAAAAAAAAAASSTRACGDAGAGRERGGVVGGGGRGGARGVATTPASRRNRGARAKSGRPLAKASAHRRARKCVGVLEETTLALEEAFADAAGKGRPVLEALVLLGASHVSPREIYSVTFAEPSPDTSLPASEGNVGSGCVQGKSSLAEAYSRKLVRSVVGELSSVSFRGLGSCRVHLFLRVADAPPFVARNANSATCSSGNGTSGTKTLNTASSPHPALAPSPTPSPTSLAATTALRHLVPRPGFKIRVSRSRPAPKVSVVVSKRPSAPPSISSQPSSGSGPVGQDDRDGRRRQQAATDEGELVRGAEEGEGFRHEHEHHQQQQQQQLGVWHQLVCARLVGLKGCDSLAG